MHYLCMLQSHSYTSIGVYSVTVVARDESVTSTVTVNHTLYVVSRRYTLVDWWQNLKSALELGLGVGVTLCYHVETIFYCLLGCPA